MPGVQDAGRRDRVVPPAGEQRSLHCAQVDHSRPVAVAVHDTVVAVEVAHRQGSGGVVAGVDRRRLAVGDVVRSLRDEQRIGGDVAVRPGGVGTTRVGRRRAVVDVVVGERRPQRHAGRTPDEGLGGGAGDQAVGDDRLTGGDGHAGAIRRLVSDDRVVDQVRRFGASEHVDAAAGGVGDVLQDDVVDVLAAPVDEQAAAVSGVVGADDVLPREGSTGVEVDPGTGAGGVPVHRVHDDLGVSAGEDAAAGPVGAGVVVGDVVVLDEGRAADGADTAAVADAGVVAGDQVLGDGGRRVVDGDAGAGQHDGLDLREGPIGDREALQHGQTALAGPEEDGVVGAPTVDDRRMPRRCRPGSSAATPAR